MSGLAMGTILTLPVLAGWALYVSNAPAPVRNFRLQLTLATMMVTAALIWMKQYRLDKELARANRELREDSLTDVLTGAGNRRFLSSTIEADVRHALRAHSSVAAAQGKRNRDLVFYIIDADCFKEVNDRYGHDWGDQFLFEMARRVSSAIRYSDALIRWGGDEFLVVSRYTDRDDADALASRVLTAVAREPFELKGGITIERTCSIGWAVFPWFVHDPEKVKYSDVLRLADCALYEAKHSGKNQAVGMLPTRAVPAPGMGSTLGGRNDRLTEHLSAQTLVTPGPQARKPLSAAAAFTMAKAAAAAQES